MGDFSSYFVKCQCYDKNGYNIFWSLQNYLQNAARFILIALTVYELQQILFLVELYILLQTPFYRTKNSFFYNMTLIIDRIKTCVFFVKTLVYKLQYVKYKVLVLFFTKFQLNKNMHRPKIVAVLSNFQIILTNNSFSLETIMFFKLKL